MFFQRVEMLTSHVFVEVLISAFLFSDTYSILPRNCYALNMETGERYALTDRAGCAIEPHLFPEWTRETPSVTQATFRTFKWPDSSMIRFQCDCSACVGSCPQVCKTNRQTDTLFCDKNTILSQIYPNRTFPLPYFYYDLSICPTLF
jgi:hypothetical protein